MIRPEEAWDQRGINVWREEVHRVLGGGGGRRRGLPQRNASVDMPTPSAAPKAPPPREGVSKACFTITISKLGRVYRESEGYMEAIYSLWD